MVAASLAAAAGAQQSDVTLSPFVTFLPTGSAWPMTGLALTYNNGPVALRASGHLSLLDRGAPTATSTATTRPWGLDADAIAYLESLSYGERIDFTPYVFVGVSTAAVDTAARRINRQGWSYGGGLALPIGSVLGVFGEWRWRMSRFVWPNSADAPAPSSEVRLGLSFRIGGGGEGGVVPSISGEDGELAWDSSPSPSAGASRVLSTAGEYVGIPYRRGGSTPSSGFDAAGFVRFVFARLGVMLPRTSRDQARVGERVRNDWHIIAPGDLVMFQDDGGINHVAIYVGKSRIIHSSETGGG